jgi:hypothetical protein
MPPKQKGKRTRATKGDVAAAAPTDAELVGTAMVGGDAAQGEHQRSASGAAVDGDVEMSGSAAGGVESGSSAGGAGAPATAVALPAGVAPLELPAADAAVMQRQLAVMETKFGDLMRTRTTAAEEALADAERAWKARAEGACT